MINLNMSEICIGNFFAPCVKLQITPIPIEMNGLHLQNFAEQQ